MPAASALTPKTILDLYTRMLFIRRVEEKIAALYPEQEMKCPVHLSIGQEAAAAGVCAALNQSDYVFSTHRCHSHYLAKGGDIKQMFAELYGKSTGCSKGKGGSMHLVDIDQGMMGASAIVGGTIPIAVGAALSASFQKKKSVSVAFFGDAATEQGVFAESLNFAALKKLPVLFICENNFFATHTPLTDRQAVNNISERGKIYNVPGVCLEGDNVLEIYKNALPMVERARSGNGPSILEVRAYRWKEHVGPNQDYNLGYRTQEELEEWMSRCPITNLEKEILNKKWLDKNELENAKNKIDQKIEDAVAFAKSSPFPEPAELLTEID